MRDIVKVGMADLKVVKSPDGLTTLGLGSCVGIVLFDSFSKVGGLAHIMLPSSSQVRNNLNRAKFADTAIVDLVENMLTIGAHKRNITAKLAGGAQMFSFSNTSDLMKIGERNVIASKQVLMDLSIPIVAEDTGGNYGRTIELDTNNGMLFIKTIGHGSRYI